jgi:hypothetical protein
MSLYLRKLLTPLPLITMAVSAVTFWMTRVWWIMPLGCVAAGIIAAQSLLAERQGTTEEEDGGVGYDLAVLHPEMRESFRLILAEKEKILNELKEDKGDACLNGRELASRVSEQVESYYDLLVKLEKIRPFIGHDSMAAMKRSIEDLERQIDKCSDDVTRENLTQALKSKTDQMNRLTELTRYRSRVESQLENLLATLNGLYLRIVQMRLSPDTSIDPTGEIKESINNMLLDVGISEKVSREYQRILSENAL